MNGINLSDWALRHRSLVVYMMIIAVVAGGLFYFRLGRNEDPAFIIKTMVVQAAWPGASVEETMKQVTERLERSPAGNAASRLPAKFYQGGRLDRLRESERAVPARGRSPTPGTTCASPSATCAIRCPPA